MEGNHATWKDFLPRTWISYHIPGFPTTYLFFLPHTLVGLDVAVATDGLVGRATGGLLLERSDDRGEEMKAG